jgi:hypothetical protein
MLALFFFCCCYSEFLKPSGNQCLHKSFAELLYLASIDRQGNTCAHQEDNLLLLTNAPDLSKINRFMIPSMFQFLISL